MAAPAPTRVANNPEEPGAAVSAGKGPKVSKGSQRRLLHDVFRIVFIPHQPARQPIRGIEMGKNDLVKTLAGGRRVGRLCKLSCSCERSKDVLSRANEADCGLRDQPWPLHLSTVMSASVEGGQERRPPTAPTQDSYDARTRGSKMTRAMKPGAPRSFGAQLKALREAAGFTQEELATIAGLSVHAVSALERGQRRRPHVETVRALSAALDLTGADP